MQDGKVYSANYGLVDRRSNIKVIPLSGRYIPARGDLVIGKVNDVTRSNWIVDINSPYEGLLHVSEFGDGLITRESAWLDIAGIARQLDR